MHNQLVPFLQNSWSCDDDDDDDDDEDDDDDDEDDDDDDDAAADEEEDDDDNNNNGNTNYIRTQVHQVVGPSGLDNAIPVT